MESTVSLPSRSSGCSTTSVRCLSFLQVPNLLSSAPFVKYHSIHVPIPIHLHTTTPVNFTALAELAINVDVSVSVDNVELRHTDNGLVCHASLTILSEWPVTDARVADSRLMELINGGVRLDSDRVWHPDLVIVGSYHFQRLTRRLELRTSPAGLEAASPGLQAKGSLNRPNMAQPSGAPRISSSFSQQDLPGDSTLRQTPRRELTKLTGSGGGGSDHNLGINLCFAQTGRMIHNCLVPLILAVTSLILLWNGPIGTRESTWLQLALLILMSGLWTWLNQSNPTHTGLFGLIGVWCLICFLFILVSVCLAVVHERWVCRTLLRQRRRRLTRPPSTSLLQAKGPTALGPPVGLNPNPNGGCFQSCACGSSSGTCPESCMNCSTVPGGRASAGGFMPVNGSNGVYCSNSSCGGASGHGCGVGLGTLAGANTASNSPAPMGFSAQPMGMGTTKLDTYAENFICSGNSDPGNGPLNDTFHGFRWRNGPFGRRSNGVGRIGVDLAECQLCSCPFSTTQPHQCTGSPAPPYTSVSSSVPPTLPSNCCVNAIRSAITVLFVLTSAIFWIAVLAQGTVPDACLGASLCQLVSSVYTN
ncbi:hypothetical protein T265_01364 [Opisthorchis viverrini]|uniref:Neurotransmitter-gated ion-channel ligand-binding domain-containing protein n=1 Tax=Opisthorchis viverrini TaxID=6198 RepID=A0A075A051_OPIVI|nr:hypothetical protein T265_01364 [Opisthorchis viverrini]KER32686.1 hypothetical protein T265_01364 [Opisthorchis viverrini]